MYNILSDISPTRDAACTSNKSTLVQEFTALCHQPPKRPIYVSFFCCPLSIRLTAKLVWVPVPTKKISPPQKLAITYLTRSEALKTTPQISHKCQSNEILNANIS